MEELQAGSMFTSLVRIKSVPFRQLHRCSQLMPNITKAHSVAYTSKETQNMDTKDVLFSLLGPVAVFFVCPHKQFISKWRQNPADGLLWSAGPSLQAPTCFLHLDWLRQPARGVDNILHDIKFHTHCTLSLSIHSVSACSLFFP